MALLSKRFTVRQQDFVKSFVVIFPMVYCALDIYVPHFRSSDLFTKCMYTSVFTVCLLSLSIIILWAISRVEQRPVRHGVFFLIGPPVMSCLLFIDGARPNLFSGGRSAFVYFVLNNYFYFFTPFCAYAFFMGVMKKLDNRRDKKRNHVDEETADGKSDEKPK